MKLLDKTTKRLLCKEAALSSMNLGVGLTFLRKHNFAEIGFIYQSFFSLSVGLERLLKLILLYEYLYENNSFPDENYLKSKGHNIHKLFSETRKLTSKYSGGHYFELVDQEPICDTILKNLSDFAVGNRYSHLNHLSGNNSTDDPLRRWENEVNQTVVKRHYRLTRKDEKMQELAVVLNSSSIIRHNTESDRDINDYSSFMTESLQIKTKQRYSMYYTFFIIKAICELQLNQNYASRTDIDIHEFFKTFRVEYEYARKRKSWNPYSPYKF